MYALNSRPYLNTNTKEYCNIVTINQMPKGPLSKAVRRVNFPPLSQFKGVYNSCNNCGLALLSMDMCNNKCNGLMSTDEVPNLFSYLVTNGYKIDTSVTKMMNQSSIRFNTQNADTLIAFISFSANT
jgi:hypothetical protein